MDPSNDQLQQQHAEGNAITPADPLRDSPCIDFPQVPQDHVELSLFIPETRIYPHPYIKASEKSISGPGELHSPGPRSSPQKGNSKVASPQTTRVYHHPYVKVSDYPSSSSDDLPPPHYQGCLNKITSEDSTSDDDDDDEDLPPPRPKGSQNKFVFENPHSVGKGLLLSPPEASQNKAITKALQLPWFNPASNIPKPNSEQALKVLNTIFFSNLLAESGVISAETFQWVWAVPEKMHYPWMKYTEAQAQEIVSNAELNTWWKGPKSACTFPSGGEGQGNYFSTYDSVLLHRWIDVTVKAINKSRAAGAAVDSLLGHSDDTKVWEVGCDFAIFSHSNRVKLQNTAIVPFELFGTCDQARDFFSSEKMLRKLAHLDLLTIFELPDITVGQELSKIAFAFFKGDEIPENVDNLPVSPEAYPKEYHIDYEGRSDRAKVVKSKPLQDPVLALFLQDVMISNHLEHIRVENSRTLSGSMQVRPGCGSSEVKTKLKARERWIGSRTLNQNSEAQNKRQQRRRKLWRNRHVTSPALSLDVINCVPKLVKLIEAGQGKSYSLSDRSGPASSDDVQIDVTGNTAEDVGNPTKSKTSKTKRKTKKSKAVASIGLGPSLNNESSAILPPSVSDTTATNSTKLEIPLEDIAIVGPIIKESNTSIQTAVLEAESTSVAPSSSQPSSSGVVPVVPSGMIKKSKKKKKNASNGNNSSDPTPSLNSQEQSTVGSVVAEPVDVSSIEAKFVQKTDPVVLTEDSHSSASSQERSSKLNTEHGINALGISMPIDSEDGTWETVKPRSAQKQKVNVQSNTLATRGDAKEPATTLRSVVRQLHAHQGPKISTPLAKTGQMSKVVPTTNPTATKPKELRFFDPNEYPAMPTLANDKNKLESKETVYDTQPVLSENSPASELAKSLKQAPHVTPDIMPIISGATTPKLESSAATTSPAEISDIGDLYGASPPRRDRIAPKTRQKITPTERAKDIKDITSTSKSADASQAVIKPAVPRFSTQDPNCRKSPIAVPNMASKIAQKPSSVAPCGMGKETHSTSSKDVTSKHIVENPFSSKLSAQNAGEKTATEANKSDIANPKLDSKNSIAAKVVNDGNVSGTFETKIKIATPAAEGFIDVKCKAKALGDPKADSVVPATGSTSTESKGKANYSKLSSRSKVAGPVSDSNLPENMDEGDASATEPNTFFLDSSTKSNEGKSSASILDPTHAGGPKKSNKKKVHKGRKDGSSSDSVYADVSTILLPAESMKLPALDQNVYAPNDFGTRELSHIVQSVLPAATSTSDAVVQSSSTSTEAIVKTIHEPKYTIPKPVVAPEQIVLRELISLPQKPDLINVRNEGKTSVPNDLAWADLVSPTKPGYLKKRRMSADNTTPDDDDLEATPPPPVRRRSSLSVATTPGRLKMEQLTPLIAGTAAIGDDPFVSGVNDYGNPEVSYLSSSTECDADLRDSRASPETHVTPRTDLMHTPSSPEKYDGEPFVNILGHEVTLFRRDAEISDVQEHNYHQQARSGPEQGSQFMASASSSNPPLAFDYEAAYRAQKPSGRGTATQSNVNSGEGTHSHPEPTSYGAPQVTTPGAYQDGEAGQGSTSSQSLGGDLKGKGPDKGTQSGNKQGLSPIPEAPLNSEAEAEEVYDHNPPTKCHFCEDTKIPTADNPFYFCPLCGVDGFSPRYCSRTCMLANSWEHTGSCLNSPAYTTNSNCNLGPTYVYIPFPMSNCHYMPDSPEKYRQKIFAMFCKFGEVPDFRYAHSRKWPDIDWSRILPSCARQFVGDYHIFKSSATQNRFDTNPSKAHVICTIKLPNRNGVNLKLMITRCLNVAFVTHDTQIVWFLGRLLRYILMQPLYFQSFLATESQQVVMTEFKSQFFKEFGVVLDDNEPLIDPAAGFRTVEDQVHRYEIGLGSLQYWIRTFYNSV